MKTIWKKTISMAELQNLEAPKGAQILAFKNQRETPCIWFLCDPTAETERLGTLRLIGTGQQTNLFDGPDCWAHIGTDIFLGGDLVLHAFLLVEQE